MSRRRNSQEETEQERENLARHLAGSSSSASAEQLARQLAGGARASSSSLRQTQEKPKSKKASSKKPLTKEEIQRREDLRQKEQSRVGAFIGIPHVPYMRVNDQNRQGLISGQRWLQLLTPEERERWSRLPPDEREEERWSHLTREEQEREIRLTPYQLRQERWSRLTPQEQERERWLRDQETSQSYQRYGLNRRSSDYHGIPMTEIAPDDDITTPNVLANHLWFHDVRQEHGDLAAIPEHQCFECLPDNWYAQSIPLYPTEAEIAFAYGRAQPTTQTSLHHSVADAVDRTSEPHTYPTFTHPTISQRMDRDGDADVTNGSGLTMKMSNGRLIIGNRRVSHSLW